MIENRDLVADVPNLNCIPLIYYPLSVMCVDDEDLMLKGLKHNLGKTYQIITVDNPFTAIEKLKDLQTNLITINYLKKTINHQESDYTDIQLNIKLEQLYNLFNDENKENEVGVVISDYMMHDMNGLEFCKKITQLPCKKMLLTQRQDTQKIYLAFQNNIIHLFYEKTQTDLIFNLLKAIEYLTFEYFLNATNHLKNCIEAKALLPTSDPIFRKFFLKLKEKYSICSFCTINLQGSMILINSQNQKLFLIVHTDESLNEFTKAYNDLEVKIFIDPVLKREKIPFFGINIEPVNINTANWGKYLFKPEKFIGEKTYYWHLLEGEL